MDGLDSLTGVPLFQTGRLTCRKWLPSDIDMIFRVYADPEGARWVGDGTPISREDCERWLVVTAGNYVSRGYGMFALDDRETGDTLGFCGLVHPGGQSEAEVKYAFLRSHWGRGYASEVVPQLLAYGAGHHGLEKVIATVASGNTASQRVLLKSGFAFEKIVNDEHGTTRVYVWHAIHQTDPGDPAPLSLPP